MTPVLFLDFDGVIASIRVHQARGDRPDHEKWIDPIACEMLAKLQKKHGFKIVISSSWRGMEKRCRDSLTPSGLVDCLHEDWRTNNSPSGFRGEEVADWLQRNGNPEYVILDDDSDFHVSQMPRFVQTDTYDGFLWRHYDQLDKLLSSICSQAEAA